MDQEAAIVFCGETLPKNPSVWMALKYEVSLRGLAGKKPGGEKTVGWRAAGRQSTVKHLDSEMTAGWRAAGLGNSWLETVIEGWLDAEI